MMRRMVFCIGVLMLMSLEGPAQRALDPLSAQTFPGDGPRPASMPPDPPASADWETIIQQIAREEYHITWQDGSSVPMGRGAYQSPNRAHGFRTYFMEDGILVVPRGESEPKWKWGLALVSSDVGSRASGGDILRGHPEPSSGPREGELEAGEKQKPGIHLSDNRIEFDRGWITEWYVNSPEGLEQGFTVHQPPAQSVIRSEELGEAMGQGGPELLTTDYRLHIDLRLTGDLHPKFSDDGQAVDFYADGPVAALRYDKLKVTDATGRVLPSRFKGWVGTTGFQLSASGFWHGGVRISIEAHGAVYPITVDPLASSPAWTAESDQLQSGFGLAVSTAGDVNGDGFADVMVGAPQFDNGQTDEGKVFVYLGSASGLGSSPAWSAESNQVSALFGTSVSTAGDVNGDGYGDVVIGAPLFDNGQTDEGRSIVYLGSASGLALNPAWISESDQSSANFGQAVSLAGDVNNDGYSDVIIGAPWFSNGQAGEGRAFVFHGSSAGLNPAVAWTAESDIVNAVMGCSVATAGDVNGDGYADVVVGASWYSYGHSVEGKAYVYHGSASGLGATAAWAYEANKSSTALGVSAASAGDVNGDGFSDIIVGAAEYDNGQTDEGRALVFHGSSTGLTSAPAWTVESNQTNARMGLPVGSAGDVNGDGYADVLVGAHLYDNGQPDEGLVFLYYGASAGLHVNNYMTLECNQSQAYFGYSVAAAGDVNGDGFSDVIAGAYGFDNDLNDEGRAFLYLGSASSLRPWTSWTVEPDQMGAGLGVSVGAAGDVNGDGYDDVVVGAPFFDNGQTDEGAAFLFLGVPTGLSGSPAWSSESDQASAYWGYSAKGVGDVNGDGFEDILVGGYQFDGGQADEGRVALYLGGSGGPEAAPAWTAEGDQAGAWFGLFVERAGDVNGDGYADFAVGAPGFDGGQADEGRVSVYLGSSSGPGPSAVWSYEPDQAGANAGYSCGDAGDVNRDGFSDLIVGVLNYDNGETDEGQALVFLGSAGGPAASPVWTMESDQAMARLGRSVAGAGDVNGDGFSDIIVGAIYYDNGETDEGRALVFLGNGTGLSPAPAWIMEINNTGACFGGAVDSAGDVNGDGFSDVIVGAHLLGRAYLYLGSAAGLGASPPWIGDTYQNGSYFGAYLAGAGDVNGDGYSDVFIGAYGFDNGQSDEGRAYLFVGNYALGMPLLARDKRADLTAPIAPLGKAEDGELALSMIGRTPFGRGKVRLEWQIAPLGGTFDPVLNPIQTETAWSDAGTAGVLLAPNVTLGPADGPYLWRVRTRYHPVSSPLQAAGPWMTPAASSLRETDLRRSPACHLPQGAVWLTKMTKSAPDGHPVLHFQDSNPVNQRTGWNVHRSDLPALSKNNWPLAGSNIADQDPGAPDIQWTDSSGSTGTWFYQVTAYNSICPAEGPF